MVRKEQELGIPQRLKRFAIATAFVGLSAWVAAESASPAHADPPSLPDRFYELVDRTRREHGLPPLQRFITLERVADHRARQISAGGKLAHRENGKLIIDSLFPLYGEDSIDFTRAEVLGWEYPAGEQALENIINRFKQSCTHRNIILWPEAERVGIGIVVDKEAPLEKKTIFVAGVLIGNGSPSKDCP